MTPDEAALVITSYYFAPAGGGRWGVTLEDFAQAARGRWPNCTTALTEDDSGVAESAEFAMIFEGGAERSGEYSHTGLTLTGYTALDAAEFMSWFVAMLDSDVRVLFNNRESIEDGDYDDHVLPRAMGLRPMAEALATHLAGALVGE
ncbi:hypothetical protein SSOG_02400 [Streptomyces himastatinicus ATCC 53653]|uniref:Uncharacterized protein n=1 Tax=Streptomyces himastatinicus ATCC 53653 TaxID=457427 RepID=D9W8H9_9ACTN|nr:hypothetical protein [Streptomyces himastatinicus]EFL22686.1 hypothetical protein SSOG_02400 [Streptomyces himastatinicus ATCC 53653]